MLEMKDCFIWDHSFDNNSFIRWNRWRLDENEKKIEIICHHLHQYFYILLGGYFHCDINRQLGKGKGLCKIDFAQNKCILSCTQIFLCKYKQGLAKNQKTSGLWNKLELIHSCLPIQIALYTSLAVLQHGQSSKYLSVVRIAKHAEWRWLHMVEVWPNMHPSVSLTLPLIC